MKNKRYKPLVDKLFYMISIPTAAMMIGFTVLGIFEPTSLWVILPVDALIFYFLISPLFGWVELRENSVFIKFGFFTKREIAYSKIRGVDKVRRWYSDSMLSIKNSFEHLNIKYNSFDMLSVSVVENDELVEELSKRCHR